MRTFDIEWKSRQAANRVFDSPCTEFPKHQWTKNERTQRMECPCGRYIGFEMYAQWMHWRDLV